MARQVLLQLLGEGTLHEGLTYGSAFSGIDTFAAAVEAELGERWTYVFASEIEASPRAALLKAWGPRGLKSCYEDALGEGATSAPTVDLYVTSPECTAHSKRNHSRSATSQRTSLEAFWKSLGYVRARHPTVVVVENVNEPSSNGPITGLLARLSGYKLETGTLDPLKVARMPISRERQFWVLRSTVAIGGQNS